MMGVPSCGDIVAALMQSVRCVGVCLGVASLQTSLRVASMVPADRRFVSGSRVVCVCV